jgi:hypothetical protein
VAKGTPAGQLHRYAVALVHAHNSAETDDALNNSWGFIASVFNHPYLTCLRPLSPQAADALKVSITMLANCADEDTPAFILSLPASEIAIPPHGRAKVLCPPILRTAPAPLLDREAPSTDDPLAEPPASPDHTLRSHTPLNPFSNFSPQGPPPKWLRTGNTLLSSFPSANIQHSSLEDDRSVFQPGSLQPYNPVPENVPLSGSLDAGDLDGDWHLPFTQKGQAILPFLPHSWGRSAALLTAI